MENSNPLQLRNKLIMAPLKLGYCTGDGKINERHLRFYQSRADHPGAITPEPLYLDKGLREVPTQLGIDHDDKIPGLQKLTGLIHSRGAKAIAHLNHPGRMANPKIPGNYFVSSTDQACENGGAVPKAMDRKDMMQAINLFIQGARRAKEAGFDIIEVQLGHGYLAAQFLSPAVNNRQDEYGKSFENRSRFPLEIIESVIKAVDIPVVARISGDEMIPDGFHLNEMLWFVRELKPLGVAAVHVSAGTVCSTPPWFFQHMFVPKGKTWEFAANIEKQTGMPAIFVGRIHSKEDVIKLEQDYKASYLAIGRALVADEAFAGKVLDKVPGHIRPCLACSEGCLGGVKSGQGLGCVVNPMVGMKEEEIPVASSTKKKIAVVGAGLAGMQAALTLHERGHEVEIFEKEQPGGQFNLAWLPPKKESLKEIVDYYIREISEKQIPLISKEANSEILQTGGYDEVVLATGAVPAVPPVKGLKEYYWTEFLHDDQLPQKEQVLIIGGGLIGMELASKLVERDNRVTVVEMLDEVARGMESIEKALTLKKLKNKGVTIYTNTRVTGISENKMIHLSGVQDFTLGPVDKIVVATGMTSYHPLAEELEGKIKIHIVGDALQPGKAQTAIRSAYQVCSRL